MPSVTPTITVTRTLLVAVKLNGTTWYNCQSMQMTLNTIIKVFSPLWHEDLFRTLATFLFTIHENVYKFKIIINKKNLKHF